MTIYSSDEIGGRALLRLGRLSTLMSVWGRRGLLGFHSYGPRVAAPFGVPSSIPLTTGVFDTQAPAS